MYALRFSLERIYTFFDNFYNMSQQSSELPANDHGQHSWGNSLERGRERERDGERERECRTIISTINKIVLNEGNVMKTSVLISKLNVCF